MNDNDSMDSEIVEGYPLINKNAIKSVSLNTG